MKIKDIKSVVTKLANAAALRDVFRNLFQGVGGNLNSLHIYFINMFRKGHFSTEYRSVSKFSGFYRLPF